MEDEELFEMLASFECDPLGHTLWAFPWGEPGQLQDRALETWQYELYDDIGIALRKNQGHKAVRVARASGHGIGKSAATAHLTLWAMGTMTHTKGAVTANTENQLKTKTWAELAKWHRLYIAKHLFEVTATAIFPRDPEARSTWRIDMSPWSIHNTEAFAGLHNENRRVFLLMDEASAIPDLIHEVSEGVLTDENTQIIWAMFGNPTKNSGRFRDAFDDQKFGKRWNHKAIDSRTVTLTNKQQLKEWEEDYGADSDFFKVRVKGEFPSSDNDSFIPAQLVREAVAAPLPNDNPFDVVIGVDVARFGDDATVIYPRRGRDARTLAPIALQGKDTIFVAYAIRDAVMEHRAVAVFVDEGGSGAGVIDVLRTLQLPCMIHGVNFGGKSDIPGPELYLNKRAEIYGGTRQWLRQGGCLPEKIKGLDRGLVDDLSATSYFMRDAGVIQLEAKRDIKTRLGFSPDIADALALTFTIPFPPRLLNRYGEEINVTAKPLTDYDPFERTSHELRRIA
jgi:hypothetical protein